MGDSFFSYDSKSINVKIKAAYNGDSSLDLHERAIHAYKKLYVISYNLSQRAELVNRDSEMGIHLS